MTYRIVPIDEGCIDVAVVSWEILDDHTDSILDTAAEVACAYWLPGEIAA